MTISSLIFFCVASAVGKIFLQDEIIVALNTMSCIIDMTKDRSGISFIILPSIFLCIALSAIFGPTDRSTIPFPILLFSPMLKILSDMLLVVPLGMAYRCVPL